MNWRVIIPKFLLKIIDYPWKTRNNRGKRIKKKISLESQYLVGFNYSNYISPGDPGIQGGAGYY